MFCDIESSKVAVDHCKCSHCPSTSKPMMLKLNVFDVELPYTWAFGPFDVMLHNVSFLPCICFPGTSTVETFCPSISLHWIALIALLMSVCSPWRSALEQSKLQTQWFQETILQLFHCPKKYSLLWYFQLVPQLYIRNGYISTCSNSITV